MFPSIYIYINKYSLAYIWIDIYICIYTNNDKHLCIYIHILVNKSINTKYLDKKYLHIYIYKCMCITFQPQVM